VIALGFTDDEKDAAVARYCRDHAIRSVVVLSPPKFVFRCSVDHEVIEYEQIILYRYYYPLLQKIDRDTLVVINECLRTQNRAHLTYNCIRNFLRQTSHQLIFQSLPIIDGLDDFMVLVDFDTRSRWRRDAWRAELRHEVEIAIKPLIPSLSAIAVETDAKTRAAYAREKRRLIDNIGLRDPHTIPRNLYLMSGRAKLAHVASDVHYLGRNNRFKIPTLRTYREDAYPDRYTVFELCHNFIDFADFLALSRQTEIPLLVADLKVDRWYVDRYQSWIGRVRDAYAALHG
jgi:hypothetical protein